MQFDVDTESTSMLSESGEPQIPWQMVRVLLSPNTKLDTVAFQLDAVYEPVEGVWTIDPLGPIGIMDEDDHETIIWPADKRIVNGRDADIYENDDFWPPAQGRLVGTGQLRSWKIAQIAIPLVRYNPVTGQILKLVDAELNVVSEKESQKAAKTAQKVQKRSRHATDRVRQLTVNFDQAAAAYAGETELEMLDYPAAAEGEQAPASPNINDTGYVIITTNAIESASTKLAAFVAHKQSLGYTVNVITEDQYGTGHRRYGRQ